MNIDIFSTPLRTTLLKENLKSLKKFINDFSKKNESRNISNRGGYQSKNIYKDEFSSLTSLFENLQDNVDNFSKELLLTKKPQIRNLWININGYKDSNVEHTHAQSLISGVFYVTVPENSGDLMFNNKLYPNNNVSPGDVVEYNSYTASSWIIKPEENLLILFPSWAPHEVLPNLNKKLERISIAFNA